MSGGWETTPMAQGTLEANYQLGMPPLSGEYIPEIPAAGFPPTINYGAAQLTTTQGVPFSPLAISLKNQQTQLQQAEAQNNLQMREYLNALDKEDPKRTAVDPGPDFRQLNESLLKAKIPLKESEVPDGEKSGSGSNEGVQTSTENNPQPDQGQGGTEKKEVKSGDTGPHKDNAMFM